MQILHSISELARLPGPLFLAIGVFDGVHRGHQAVISTSARHAQLENGTPVVVTFDPHPMKVLRPDDAPHLLTATPHKIALIRDRGGRFRVATGDAFETAARNLRRPRMVVWKGSARKSRSSKKTWRAISFRRRWNSAGQSQWNRCEQHSGPAGGGKRRFRNGGG